MSDYPPIEDHGLIGDLHTAALVAVDGTIDFLPFPSFDSPTVCASLLDRRRGGCFELKPVIERAAHKQLYLPDTAVLLTRTLSDDGVAEISDFMPIAPGEPAHTIVRRAKCVRGEIPFRMRFAPRFDYARGTHRVESGDGETRFVPEGGGPALRLRHERPVRIVNGDAVAEFTLRPNETAAFVLEQLLPGVDSAAAHPDGTSEAFKHTSDFWRAWVGRSRYRGRWRETVNRSALTLKLLTSQPHGSIVAAATFGLPEVIGGVRNWDYRYTWIRDASFTLYALMRLGYTDESAAFMRWIEARCRNLEPDHGLNVLYGIDGRTIDGEQRLEHLEGYRGSAPVSVGNGASHQLQLDIYGELLDSVDMYDQYGEPVSWELWQDLTRLVEWVMHHWRERDLGIWEPRSGPHHLLYSRVMCWVALDRAVRLALRRSFPAPIERWRNARDAILTSVHREFWNAELGAFVQHHGSRTLDASTLLMPLVKAISPRDPCWLSTQKAIGASLVDDSLVHRYRTGEGSVTDGLPGQEGTFSMCTFWYVEALARSGDVPLARFIFEKMLGYANHLGLYAEELGPSGEHLGNFPQAFTHIGLISAAHYLDRALSEAGHAA
ncbi:MAG TPA: glycoside hydrolase family 15 protein [Candidatus Eisenbacteria bacterium]|nr:glycoside hydrolase family 15 protein [Candidatus Eisenbacteria bacterium]